MLGDKRFIQTIRLQNFLSFGMEFDEFELKSLNVLIGPNGSGKSNLLEAVDLLRASATNLVEPIRQGGGIDEWLWKGAGNSPVAELEVTLYYPDGVMPLRHKMSFTSVGQRFELVDESIENEREEYYGASDVRFYYRYQNGRPVLNIRSLGDPGSNGSDKMVERGLRREDLAPEQSVISQRKDPDQYPEITYLGNQYGQIKLYREWNLGRYTPPRTPQKVDLPSDFLLPDASNLGLVLNDLEHRPNVPQNIEEMLQQFYEPFNRFTTRISGGTVQIFLHEEGLTQPIPATRLSDGTLRYLCLLSILCHPTPPPLICIEEPELGLHPDILPVMAELLVDASHRTQLIVTTHSDTLVDALSHVPEAVAVCEKEDGATRLKRLDPERLQMWLEQYSLGNLWRSGELGGNRW